MSTEQATTSLQLSASEGSARSARVAVRELCTCAGVGPDVCDTAVLLTTELVMNALEHGGGDAAVDARVDVRSLRVAVGDHGPGVPQPRTTPVPGEDERGRGLLLVGALASRWGTRPVFGGKSVWFELDLA